jgi:uncharacterized protein with ParB-like and HNH nuclease domain
MKNRVYYGEYSLRHWIELLLRQNIVLPEYQRYFVWNEQKVKNLVSSLQSKQFIPPVTIGSFNNGNRTENLILDGQQRLTSIFLAYMGIYPDISVFKKTLDKLANENDDPDEDALEHADKENHGLDNILEWNINELTKKGRTKEEVISKITNGNYKDLKLPISDSFYDENYLGFCYLVPHSDDISEQQKYYSSVFRNINIQGQVLLPQESRASLYFLDQELVDLFSPDFFNKIKIKLISNESKADFLRYLSLLSQYHLNKDVAIVARGYKQKMESLYEEYIYAAINDEENKIFPKFTNVFPNKKYKPRLNELNSTLKNLDLYKSYSSIIDVDVAVFGIIYHVLFIGKSLDFTKKQLLTLQISNRIKEFRDDESHHKSPNNLKHLRDRIIESINIYGKYLKK